MSRENTGGQTSKSADTARLKAEAAEQKARREVMRYRVAGQELPEGVEPDWDHLDGHPVEKYTYGAGWAHVLPYRPVMAADVRDRTLPPSPDSRIHLTGPIWPPRGA